MQQVQEAEVALEIFLCPRFGGERGLWERALRATSATSALGDAERTDDFWDTRGWKRSQ